MAERFNVAQRLAEGAAAVEHTQAYVWACHVLGYQHPDLTAYASQVRDWYDSENDLDLRVLDDDCAMLRAAATAAHEALTRQRAQQAELAEAWTGSGADAATEFLGRHCRAGEAVAANVAAAAQRCAALRDDLWQLIDAKAATAIAIDDRRLAERPGWLAAAQTVLTGAGDRSPTDEVVDRQIKPYVDNDIRADWLDAMRSTAASADACLDAATDAVTAAPGPRFDVPGDFAAQSTTPGEPPAPPVGAVPSPVMPAGAGSAHTVPVSAGVDSEAPAAPSAAPDGVPPALPADPGSTLGDAGGLGDLGGLGGASGATGLGGLGSSIGGIISQIVDAVGGLLGSVGDGADDSSLSDDPLDSNDTDDPLNLEDEPEPEPETDPAEPDDAAEPAAPAPENAPATENSLEPPAQIEETAPPPADPEPPTTDPQPPTAEPPAPPADAEPDKSTPCEIAADELPQAGQ
jgi:hypothetical protein